MHYKATIDIINKTVPKFLWQSILSYIDQQRLVKICKDIAGFSSMLTDSFMENLIKYGGVILMDGIISESVYTQPTIWRILFLNGIYICNITEELKPYRSATLFICPNTEIDLSITFAGPLLIVGVKHLGIGQIPSSIGRFRNNMTDDSIDGGFMGWLWNYLYIECGDLSLVGLDFVCSITIRPCRANKYHNVIIKDCIFTRSIDMRMANNIILENNYFDHAYIDIICTGSSLIAIDKCYFYSVGTPIHFTGRNSRIIISNCIACCYLFENNLETSIVALYNNILTQGVNNIIVDSYRYLLFNNIFGNRSKMRYYQECSHTKLPNIDVINNHYRICTAITRNVYSTHYDGSNSIEIKKDIDAMLNMANELNITFNIKDYCYAKNWISSKQFI